jgi:hypothetical protein
MYFHLCTDSSVTIFRALFLILISLQLIKCSSTPEVVEPDIDLPKSHSNYVKSEVNSSAYNDIDITTLIEELEVNHPLSTLGYQERSFNSCSVKANRSTQPYCQQLYLGRINYQVMCRDSTGTVDRVTLTPLYSQKLRWKSGVIRGETKTNASGFGQVGFISPNSTAFGHLYLYLGSKIARKQFRDNWKLILPKSWCLDQ